MVCDFAIQSNAAFLCTANMTMTSMDHMPLLPTLHRESLHGQPQILPAPVLVVREGRGGVQEHGREDVDRPELVRDALDPSLVGPVLQSRTVRDSEGHQEAGVRSPLLAPPDVKAEREVVGRKVRLQAGVPRGGEPPAMSQAVGPAALQGLVFACPQDEVAQDLANAHLGPPVLVAEGKINQAVNVPQRDGMGHRPDAPKPAGSEDEEKDPAAAGGPHQLRAGQDLQNQEGQGGVDPQESQQRHRHEVLPPGRPLRAGEHPREERQAGEDPSAVEGEARVPRVKVLQGEEAPRDVVPREDGQWRQHDKKDDHVYGPAPQEPMHEVSRRPKEPDDGGSFPPSIAAAAVQRHGGDPPLQQKDVRRRKQRPVVAVPDELSQRVPSLGVREEDRQGRPSHGGEEGLQEARLDDAAARMLPFPPPFLQPGQDVDAQHRQDPEHPARREDEEAPCPVEGPVKLGQWAADRLVEHEGQPEVRRHLEPPLPAAQPEQRQRGPGPEEPLQHVLPRRDVPVRQVAAPRPYLAAVLGRGERQRRRRRQEPADVPVARVGRRGDRDARDGRVQRPPAPL
ncbi:hypothetical protein THAOC_33425, partial [Thalassiosira oceanica]